MAYSATITCTTHTISGRRGMVIKIVEADAASSSEWKTTHTDTTNPVTLDGVQLATGVGLPIFPVGTITLYQSELIDATSTGTTILPKMGKATGWSVGTQSEISRQTTAAASFNDSTSIPYTYNPGTRPVLFGVSGVDAGTDNDIETLIHIVEGHVVGGTSTSGGIDLAAGLELEDETAVAMDIGVGASSWITADTRAASERVITHVATYVDEGETRVGGNFFTDVGPSDAVLGTTETRTVLVKSAADIGKEIPANRLLVGTTIRYRAKGAISVWVSGTLKLEAMFGSTVIGASSAFTPADNNVWEVTGEFTIRSLGASGSGIFSGTTRVGARAGTASNVMMFSGSGETSGETIDTTADTLPGIAVTWGAGADDTNSVRMDVFTIDIQDPYVAA